MFARIVEAPAKPGKRNEIMTLLAEELMPMLRTQSGFVDFVGLTSDMNPVDGMTIAFWATKADAERFYTNPEYKALMTERITPLLEQMTIRTFDVEASTFHKVVAAKVA